jgi:hypothetical protein
MTTIGKLYKYVPQYPTNFDPTLPRGVAPTRETHPLDFYNIVILVDKDFCGFKSEVILEGRKYWIPNRDLLELEDPEQPAIPETSVIDRAAAKTTFDEEEWYTDDE